MSVRPGCDSLGVFTFLRSNSDKTHPPPHKKERPQFGETREPVARGTCNEAEDGTILIRDVATEPRVSTNPDAGHTWPRRGGTSCPANPDKISPPRRLVSTPDICLRDSLDLSGLRSRGQGRLGSQPKPCRPLTRLPHRRRPGRGTDRPGGLEASPGLACDAPAALKSPPGCGPTRKTLTNTDFGLLFDMFACCALVAGPKIV